MATQVQVLLAGERSYTLKVADDYKLGDSVLTLEHPGQWVVIPYEKGEFSARAGEILSLYSERNGDSG